MTSARRAVLAAIPAALIAGGALAAGAFAASSAARVAACKGSQLSGSMTLIPGSMGAGNVGYKLKLKHRTGRTCSLGNRPGLRLQGVKGKPLPTRVLWSGKAATVTIAARGSKSARLRFSPDIPGRGEPKKGACEPKAYGVLVTLGSPASGELTASVKPPTSVCQHGQIRAQPPG